MNPNLCLGFALVSSIASGQTVTVAPTVETDPVRNSGDAADDPAIWIHPDDPALSILIGTDKQQGMAVYNVSGRELQFLSIGELNNVDVRYNFPLLGASADVVIAGNRSNNSIEIYTVDPDRISLEEASARTVSVNVDVYGSCMYQSAKTGDYYVFVNSKDGDVEQWRLFDNGNGEIDASLERAFNVGSQTEGCVADDELGYFYIGEEARGVWKYGAEPDDGTSRSSVDSTGSSGHLTADVEGLTIYYASGGEGYLIASSQGANEYVIYERTGNNAYVGTFEIGSSNAIDGTSDTDGIDVISASLGPDFPFGAFIAQDGSNSGGNQNFKLVPWQNIAEAFEGELIIDNTWNPRQTELTTSARPRPPTMLSVD